MKNKKLIIVGIVLLVLLVAGGLVTLWRGGEAPYVQYVSTDEPVDIVQDLYDAGLATPNSTSTTAFLSQVIANPILGEALRARLGQTAPDQSVDPIFCQTVTPVRIGTRQVYESDEMLQFLVVSREPRQPGQALVTLRALAGGWYVDNIECSQGESDEPREFTFETSGVLLRQNVPDGYDQSLWHLGYVEDEIKIRLVPLLFDAQSICADENGTEAACDVERFSETQKVSVQGNMTESGATVVRLTVVQ